MDHYAPADSAFFRNNLQLVNSVASALVEPEDKFSLEDVKVSKPQWDTAKKGVTGHHSPNLKYNLIGLREKEKKGRNEVLKSVQLLESSHRGKQLLSKN